MSVCSLGSGVEDVARFAAGARGAVDGKAVVDESTRVGWRGGCRRQSDVGEKPHPTPPCATSSNENTAAATTATSPRAGARSSNAVERVAHTEFRSQALACWLEGGEPESGKELGRGNQAPGGSRRFKLIWNSGWQERAYYCAWVLFVGPSTPRLRHCPFYARLPATRMHEPVIIRRGRLLKNGPCGREG